MNNYVDYAYYTDTYGGSLVPSTKFDYYACQTTQYIRINTLGNINEDETIPDEVKMCCCKLCDIVYSADTTKISGITAEKVGEYSVSYEATESIKDICKKEMNDTLRLWLADTGLLYRGL